MSEVKLRGFTGINNQAAADALAKTDFAVATNVDVDDAKRIRRRAGSIQRLSADSHSMFPVGDALYYRTGAELRRADPVSWVDQLMDTGLGGNTVYGAVGDRLFYSDGAVARTLKDGEGARSWGITPPLFAPAMAQAAGALPTGGYLCTMTYRTAEGLESGAPTPERLELEGGIAFTMPVSADPAVTEKVVYLSRAGGETLYRAFAVANATMSATYGGDGSDFGAELETLHKTPPPASQLIGAWNGRMAVGTANFLLYSDLFRYEQFDPIRQSVPFDNTVTLIAALTPKACIVGTSASIWRLDGGDFASAAVTQLADYGAIPGSGCTADMFADDGAVTRSVFFASPKGLCMANATELVNLTGKRYRTAATQGSSLFRGADGNHQAIFSLRATP